MSPLKKKLFQEVYGWVVPSPWRRHRYAVYVSLFGVIIAVWMFIPRHQHDEGKSPVLAAANMDSLADNMRWLSHRMGYHTQTSLVQKQASNTLPRLELVSHPRSHSLVKALSKKRLSAPVQIYQDDNGRSKVLHQSQQSYLDAKDILMAGEVIDATIESAVSTDLAGQVRAMVSEPVYAYLGRDVLIPIGSRLLGHYQTVSHQQQMRIWVRWDRVVLPDGQSLKLDSPSVDPMGQAGSLADKVNYHAWERFRDAALLSLLSNGALVSGGLDASTETAGQVLRSQVADRFSNAAEQSWVSNHVYQPTAFLYPGHRIKIVVMHDIDCKKLVATDKKSRNVNE